MASSIVISILGDSRDLTRSLGQSEKKLGAFGKAAKLAGGIAAGALAAGVGVAGTALVKGFSRLQGIDQAKSKLTGLGHSADSVAAIMQNATDAVTGTAFGLDAAASVAASTVAAGVKPGKDLERTLKLVGDAATIAGTDMGSMGSIFNKVAASDMIQGDVIAQLGDKGIPILQFLGKELGVTAQEAKKMASAGKVDFATFQSAMENGLGGAAQESGKTFAGAMANMNAALGRLGARVLDGAFQKMPGLFTAAGTSLDKLAPAADRIGAALGTAMTRAGETITSLTPTIQRLAGTLKTTADSALAALLPPLQRVIGFIKGDGVAGFTAFAQQLAQTVIPIGRQLVGLFTGTILPALQTVITYVATAVAPVFIQAFEVVRANVVPILTELAGFLAGTLYPAVWGIVESVGSHLRPVFDAIVEVVQKNVLPTVQKLLGRFRDWQPTIQRVVKVAVSLTGTVLKFAAAILGRVLPPVIRFAGFLLGKVVGAVSSVIGVVVGAVGKVLDFGSAFIRAARTVGRGVGRVVSFVKDIPKKVLDVITDLGEDLLEAGKKLMGKLSDGIKAGAAAPFKAMKGGAKKLRGLFPGSPVKEGPLTSFNNGRAGRTLMAMLAQGIKTSTAPALAMRDVAADLDHEARRALTPPRHHARPTITGTSPSYAGVGGGHVIRVELTAEELHSLERGRRLALDLRPYRAAGGALG